MRIRIKFWLCLIGSILLWALTSRLQATDLPEFEHVTLDDNIGKVCYAVTVADVNGDYKPDAVALSENRLIWFENPSWKPHVILENQLDLDHVCMAAADIDGDRLVDFAIGAGWTKKGTIQWVSRDKANPDGLWKVYPIAEELWTHRMSWGSILGNGTTQLTVSALNRSTEDGARLLAFSIPKNPRTDRWIPTVMNTQMNRMHNHYHYPYRSKGRSLSYTYTASQEGIHSLLFRDDRFELEKLHSGIQGEKAAESGCGEITIGNMENYGTFIATVEPMHGNNLVVYPRPQGEELLKQRIVLDDSLGRGHALYAADLDHRDTYEIIIGHSEPASGEIKGPGIYIFQAEGKNIEKWTKHVLDDGGIATEDLIVHDFNEDGWNDILAGGRNTHNVKLYLSQGAKTTNE